MWLFFLEYNESLFTRSACIWIQEVRKGYLHLPSYLTQNTSLKKKTMSTITFKGVLLWFRSSYWHYQSFLSLSPNYILFYFIARLSLYKALSILLCQFLLLLFFLSARGCIREMVLHKAFLPWISMWLQQALFICICTTSSKCLCLHLSAKVCVYTS